MTSPIYGDDWLVEMKTMFDLIQANAEVFKKALKR